MNSPNPSAPLDGMAAFLPDVGVEAKNDQAQIRVHARANLPTRWGTFGLVAFRVAGEGALEHLALVHGDVRQVQNVAVRLHSECMTGDVFGSERCDCRAQLEHALAAVAKSPAGVLVYLRQEGRGIGLGAKIAAYALQEQGLDTYAANKHLGFDADLRTYDAAGLMLQTLGVGSVQLMTNNPKKVAGLRAAGVVVAQRVGVQIPAGEYNKAYLRSKEQAGHWLGQNVEHALPQELSQAAATDADCNICSRVD